VHAYSFSLFFPIFFIVDLGMARVKKEKKLRGKTKQKEEKKEGKITL
jgi:hypothetical protein